MDDFLRTPVWYPALSRYTFKTLFLELSPEELRALAAGEEEGATAGAVIAKLKPLLSATPGNAFVFVDSCAPTDTERFAGKRGAVYSAKSAWKFLCRSEKVRRAAESGTVTAICVRPFRRISPPREFRLFVKGGQLAAASQYNLIRHYRRLEGVKEAYWKLLAGFFNKISGKLPLKDLVIDVYVTSGKEVLIIDLNCFGDPTSPLMLLNWEQDWENLPEPKLRLMPPPVKISGAVKVSF